MMPAPVLLPVPRSCLREAARRAKPIKPRIARLLATRAEWLITLHAHQLLAGDEQECSPSLLEAIRQALRHLGSRTPRTLDTPMPDLVILNPDREAFLDTLRAYQEAQRDGTICGIEAGGVEPGKDPEPGAWIHEKTACPPGKPPLYTTAVIYTPGLPTPLWIRLATGQGGPLVLIHTPEEA